MDKGVDTLAEGTPETRLKPRPHGNNHAEWDTLHKKSPLGLRVGIFCFVGKGGA